MWWILAAVVMVGVSAESARLDGNAAAVAAPATYAECNSSRHGVQHYASLDAARAAWGAEGGSYAMVCTEMQDGVPTGRGAGGEP